MATGEGDNSTTTKTSNVGAIAGGVIGGLAALGVIGIGVWLFLRRRAVGHKGGDYSRVSTGAPVSEHGKQPSQLRLYVRVFIVLSGLRSDRICRTHLTHQPIPPTLTTNPAGLTRPRPTTVITPALGSYENFNCTILLFLRLGTQVTYTSLAVYFGICTLDVVFRHPIIFISASR